MIRSKDTLTIDDLKDVLRKVHLLYDEEDWMLTEMHWEILGDVAGLPCHNPWSVNWLNNLLVSDNMVDTFAAMYPDTKYRYTCWDQSTNKRYSNEGTRIDHIMCDLSFWEKYGNEKGMITQLTGEMQRNENDLKEYDLGEYEAAINAATNYGMFQMASFDGNGIPDAPDIAYKMWLRPPHTGIVYTPPEFSDHVGVSVCFKRSCFQNSNIQLCKDLNTKETQPHMKQSNITSFFNKSVSITSSQDRNIQYSSNDSKKQKIK